MLRLSLIVLLLSIATLPAPAFANDNLASLEAVAVASQQAQPGLKSYLATVQTSRVEEMMTNLTSGIPSDVEPPARPVIKKFWQRDGRGLVYAEGAQLTPYVEKMVKQISSNLAVELNQMLLPAAQAEQRIALVKDADIKFSEVALAETLIHRLEIAFKQPTDLNESFYVRGIRLPQKQIKALTFDIDAKTNTVRELALIADNGLQLTLEIRYIKVDEGYIPERFQITSPDGKIDDRFEVQFVEVDSFLLPASMLRVIRRPELQEELEVFFNDYQVNQPIPEDIKQRLQGP